MLEAKRGVLQGLTVLGSAWNLDDPAHGLPDVNPDEGDIVVVHRSSGPAFHDPFGEARRTGIGSQVA